MDGSTDFADYKKYYKTVGVFGATMNYVDTGVGENAVLFLHGNPTSSFLWRNVIPHVKDIARCYAPDLIGMGQSSKLPAGSTYRFVDHYNYLSEWINQVNLPDKINLVVHDWGSALGFHWANQNRDRIQSIVHMESVVGALESWSDSPEAGRKIFQDIRSPAGEELVLQKNFFVERFIPSNVMRKLSVEEMNAYRKPFNVAGEDRRPTLTWAREVPIKGDGPEDVIAIAESYEKWLSESSNIPKLYINAKPGLLSPRVEKRTKNWPNHKQVTVPGLHFMQEDSAKLMGQAIHAFLNDHLGDPKVKKSR